MKKENACFTKIESEDEDHGQRLDKFLAEKLSDLSRSQIKKLIKDKKITVNDKIVSPHYFLKGRENIKILDIKILDNIQRPISNIKKGANNNKKLFNKIKIIHEDDNFLIINKPAGLLVHPTEKNETDTLVDWLLAQYPALKKIGEDPSRPAIVHRLDKEVSGLMLIPKTQDAFDYFKQNFKEHQITKKYAALVCGQIAKDEDEINFPISRSKTKEGLFAAHPRPSPILPLLREEKTLNAKPALTSFRVVQRFKNYTLLEVEIMTGRTHQIRVHLLAYGHPVAGDGLYNKKTKKQENHKIKFDRIFLHAHYLKFRNLNGEIREFKSELPQSLKNYLKSLK